MYDNSRVPSYTNVSSHPCRIQYSRWSLNTPNTGIAAGQILPQSTATLASSSFYFPQTQRIKQKPTPHYVNLQTLPPPTSSVSSSYLSNSQRPKSTNFHDFIAANQSTFLVHDLRQRYDSKAVVGIVKPMVHQRSYTQLNNNNNNNNNNEDKSSELVMDSYRHNSTRSLHPPSPPSPPPSYVIYRCRPTPSYNSINGQPPVAPRRHSSISNSKCLSSHRSSRTTSTSSSIAAINELSSAISAHEDEHQQEQQNDNRIIIDVKRLEMFYASVGTLVKSARSTARLYTTTTRQLANFEDWSCQQYGVPLWIYNTVRIIILYAYLFPLFFF
jgi:chemotaxis protein histidine kinase CheA